MMKIYYLQFLLISIYLAKISGTVIESNGNGFWSPWAGCGGKDSVVIGLQVNFINHKIQSLRFFCSEISEIGNDSDKYFELHVQEEKQENDTNDNWSERHFCDRGVVIGAQFLQNTQSNNTLPNIALICSDEGLLFHNEEKVSGIWSVPAKCGKMEAICGAQQEIFKNDSQSFLSGLRFNCCEINHPASDCQLQWTHEYLSECSNFHAVTPLTCTYGKSTGLTYSDHDETIRSIYQDLGFDLSSALLLLSSDQFDFKLDLEKRTNETIIAKPGLKITLNQVAANCNFYKILTPEIKKKITHQHNKQSGFYDIHGMQGDQADDDESWSDEEEDTKQEQDEGDDNISTNKKEDLHSLENDDDWISSEVSAENHEDETKEANLLNHAQDLHETSRESKEDQKKSESAVQENSKETSDEGWSDESTNDNSDTEIKSKIYADPIPNKVDDVKYETTTLTSREVELKALLDEMSAEGDWSNEDEVVTHEPPFIQTKAYFLGSPNENVRNQAELPKTKVRDPTDLTSSEERLEMSIHLYERQKAEGKDTAEYITPNVFRIPIIPKRSEGLTDAASDSKTKAQEENDGMNILGTLEGWKNEADRVINEVKEMPIVVEGQKKLEDALKTVVETGIGYIPNEVASEIPKNEISDKIVEAEGNGSNDEVKLKRGGGFVGYIVGGMIASVILIVIAVFIFEKRGNKTRVDKKEYENANPPPQPLLQEQRITIQDI